MELKEGMYVRTQKGIGKVVEHKKHESWGYLVKIIGQYSCYTHTSNGELMDVIKASYNPIDLIEVGDYVNGLRVEKNKYGELYTSYVYYGGDIGKMCEVYTTWLKEYKKDEIYSIVTKEQFESIAYKVEEE